MDGSTALDEALARLRSRSGLVLLVAFVAVGVVTVVAQQTLLDAAPTEAFKLYGELSILGFQLPPPGDQPTPFALPVRFGVAVIALGVVTLVSEYLLIVALRTVAGARLREAATRRVARAVLAGFLVGVFVRSLVLLGLFALLIPGLFVAVSLLFAHARVAIEDEGPVDALAGSWELTEGRRVRVGGVVAVLAALYLTLLVFALLIPAQTVGFLVGGVLAGAANLVSAAVVARAYVGFRDEPTDAGEQEEEDDPYDAPLGPDDLPEP